MGKSTQPKNNSRLTAHARGQLDQQITQTHRRAAFDKGRDRELEAAKRRELDAERRAGAASLYERERAPEPETQRVTAPELPLPSGGAVQTGSGIVLGVIAYAVLINWIRGGPAQVKGWILAKLINRPYDTRQVGTYTEEMRGN